VPEKVPEKVYPNSETSKAQILKENTNESGVYMWKNSINNKCYIGSSENLRVRFIQYFNTNHLLSNTSMYIYRALLKHGHSNFSLTILEYCLPDKCLIREKHYWNLFNPEYNIAKEPGAPMSGRTHSDDTKIIMSDAKKGENNPNYGKPRTEGSGSPSQAIEVTDIKNNTTTSYDSKSAAARALNIKHSNIDMYFLRNQKKPYKGRYTFKKV